MKKSTSAAKRGNETSGSTSCRTCDQPPATLVVWFCVCNAEGEILTISLSGLQLIADEVCCSKWQSESELIIRPGWVTVMCVKLTSPAHSGDRYIWSRVPDVKKLWFHKWICLLHEPLPWASLNNDLFIRDGLHNHTYGHKEHEAVTAACWARVVEMGWGSGSAWSFSRCTRTWEAFKTERLDRKCAKRLLPS